MVSLGTQVGILSAMVFVLTIVGVITPRFFKPDSNMMSYVNLMAGGVLFSAATVHFLPDASILLDVGPLEKDAAGAPYPWAFFLAAITFYFMFLLDRFVLELYMSWKTQQDTATEKSRVVPSSTGGTSEFGSDATIETPSRNGSDESDDSVEIQLGKVDPESDKPSAFDPAHESTGLISTQEIWGSTESAIPEDKTVVPEPFGNSGPATGSNRELVALVSQGDFMTAGILMFGLGIHSILEGLALGDANNQRALTSVAVAILGHKYLEGVAIGAPLYHAGLNWKSHACFGIFYSVLTPIGALVGFLLGEAGGDWVSGLLIAMTAGTFFFVSVIEIMIPEFGNHDLSLNLKKGEAQEYVYDDLKKAMAMLTGFGLMSLIGVWA